jgi:TPR repeat protein
MRKLLSTLLTFSLLLCCVTACVQESSVLPTTPESQYSLGLKYYNGDGVVQDYGQAVAWYQKAAGQGDASAQTNLG